MEDRESLWDVAKIVAPPTGKTAIQVGLGTGLMGGIVGGVVGTIKSPTPALFAIFSGLQCFTLGSSFWVGRQTNLVTQAYMQSCPVHELSSRTTAISSMVGSTFAGVVTASIWRGPRNIIPAIIVWTPLGYVGQLAHDSFRARQFQSTSTTPHENVWTRLAKSSWSPLQVISDDDYEKTLSERVLRVEAEIAILDDDLAKLRRLQQQAHSTDVGQPAK